MNRDIKNVDVYNENLNFESDYLPLIAFKSEKQKNAVEQYILNKVTFFFKRIIKIEFDVKKSQINYSNTITEKDFTEKPISYFYENIFVDLGKRDHAGKLDVSPKWGITFDQKCAPIEVSHLPHNYTVSPTSHPQFKPFDDDYHNNKKTHYRYGTIDINGKPIFYYIYFTLQEIIDVIKP
ncbi:MULTISPECIES: hypothetical protein [unclassified Microcoleus]|jgi:hypothetical protein|uniref:hypothetical protein n=1 Tax=unclassified Microcoleus TaxID=2642155 RepID=UPI002FD638B5